MLRRHLEELGHGFKLSEIKEALDILSHTFIKIRLETSDDEPGQTKRLTVHGWHDFDQLHCGLCRPGPYW